MRIIIATGASGGHIFPALAVADELKDAHELFFICDKGRMEEEIRDRGFRCHTVTLIKFRGLSSLPAFLNRLSRAYRDCLKALDDFSPQALVGFGSYAAVAAVLAARSKKIPVLIHEQNVLPGKANRFLAGFVNKIAISFLESAPYFPKGKTVYTGCPVRKELFLADRDAALHRFGFSDEKFTIMVLGGSVGSHNLNEKFIEALRDFPQQDRLRIIHLCGDVDYQWVSQAYRESGVSHLVLAFLKEMGYAYRLADLVISRAGASAIAEMTLFGLPAILVPYPFAGGHQLFNAKVLERKGAAIIIDDKNLCAAQLKQNILTLMNDRQRLKEMGKRSLSCAAPEAVKDLAAQLLQLSGEKCVS